MKVIKKRVYLSLNLPSKTFLFKIIGFKTVIIILDRKLALKPNIKRWLKNFMVYSVTAGEKLKDLHNFAFHAENILKTAENKKIQGFISLGGGSVGDFTGFLASIYNRGVPLIHIPSTWLSAIDASHGGKTALNIQSSKNIFGSYHFPKAVFIVKNMLSSSPLKEQLSAQGELIKTALLAGGGFYAKLIKNIKFKNTLHKTSKPQLTKYKQKKNKSFSGFLSIEQMHEFLLPAVSYKLKITAEDPFEKKFVRQKLNFGHTIGHVLESYFKIPHGTAVLYGITFSIQWSCKIFSISPLFLQQISFLLPYHKKLTQYLKNIPLNSLKKLLSQDKKRMDHKTLNFVFIKKPGQVFIKTVSFHQILREIQRQKILYD